MAVKRYADYDPFAWVYNKHWGDIFTPTALAVMEELLLPRLPAQARILDLGCGTGQLAQILTERGYQITGIDGSAEMLLFARENAPGVRFILDDARSFKPAGLYDAVISVFDSLNHIMTTEELTSVFRHACAALKKEGLFLFDLNLEASYRAHWNGVFGIIEEDHVCMIRNSYELPGHTARFEATIFRLQDGWQRSDVTLLQKCYSVAEVRRALQGAGFTDIHTYAYNQQYGVHKVTPKAERAFFLSHQRVKTTGKTA
jgi:SAM-dependent methyltransferase